MYTIHVSAFYALLAIVIIDIHILIMLCCHSCVLLFSMFYASFFYHFSHAPLVLRPHPRVILFYSLPRMPFIAYHACRAPSTQRIFSPYRFILTRHLRIRATHLVTHITEYLRACRRYRVPSISGLVATGWMTWALNGVEWWRSRYVLPDYMTCSTFRLRRAASLTSHRPYRPSHAICLPSLFDAVTYAPSPPTVCFFGIPLPLTLLTPLCLPRPRVGGARGHLTITSLPPCLPCPHRRLARDLRSTWRRLSLSHLQHAFFLL